jgi:uncharacterized coiled-coil protein SlyX
LADLEKELAGQRTAFEQKFADQEKTNAELHKIISEQKTEIKKLNIKLASVSFSTFTILTTAC